MVSRPKCFIDGTFAATIAPIPQWSPMHTFVYKSGRKSDTYVYLRERDAFASIPESIRASLGELSFVLEFMLTPERKLAQTDAAVLRTNLAAHGFHIQFPPQHDQGSVDGDA